MAVVSHLLIIPNQPAPPLDRLKRPLQPPFRRTGSSPILRLRRRSIIHIIHRHDIHLHRRIPFLIRTRLRPGSPIRGVHSGLSSRHIESVDRAIEHLERDQWLVKRHLVTTLVDPDERKTSRLSDLPVNNVV